MRADLGARLTLVRHGVRPSPCDTLRAAVFAGRAAVIT